MNKNKPLRGQTAEEKDFHDKRFRDANPATSWFERWIISLYPAMPSPTDKILTALGQVREKRICEIGCGGGGLARELASRGAYVSASDISTEAVRLARKINEEFIPKQVEVKEMDACSLTYNDGSFDFVVGISILHHVDIDKVSSEISRVLKPGGKAVFVEPLAHNPISNIWRRLSPSARTPDEWPLSYLEISKMGKQFSSLEYQEFALLTLSSSLVYLITHSQRLKRKSAELLARVEPVFLKICKPLRRYSGAIVIEFTK
jgi:2-polyprenyl-3-methyl-5-hydroxy-6-metoxy-1,4-benzoquinol methylase